MLSPILTVSIFQKKSDPKVFFAGQVIFEEGQPGDEMYGILEGEIDILVNGKIVETIEAGEVFNVGVLVGVKNRTYTAIAKVNSIVCKQINFFLCYCKSRQSELSQQLYRELPKLSKLDCVLVELLTGNAILPRVYPQGYLLIMRQTVLA